MSLPCRNCGHEMRDGNTSIVLWRDGISVETIAVPARVCPNCGEAYVQIDVAKELDRIADAVAVRQSQLETIVEQAVAVAHEATSSHPSQILPHPLRGLKVAWE